MENDRTNLLAVARGDRPADLLLRNAKIVNVFSGEIEESDIAIASDRIAGIGKQYSGKETIDLNGAYVAPGLIDAHVHIESSLCTPANFASAVLPRGVTTVIADPHEIANVSGIAGLKFMHESSRGLDLRVVLMAPSCVPATNMATAGAVLSARDLDDPMFHGLAEMMNFPGAIHGDAEVLTKIETFRNRRAPIDGHAPGVTDRALNAYVATGVGSDHECTTVEEAAEKLSRGLYIFIREATNAHNLDTLLPLINQRNDRRICFCTDDRTPGDLLEQGSIDYMLRRAIERGVDPIAAFRCCTLNTAEWFNLHDRGAIAPGRFADLIIFDDPRAPRAEQVFSGGRLVRPDPQQNIVPNNLNQSCNLNVEQINFDIPARGKHIRIIGSQPDQLITDHLIEDAKPQAEKIVSDVSRDLLKIAVIERHRGTGNIGLGFIRGIGLKRGAIAGTVAHDHHNLVVIGADDRSMHAAARAVATMCGGLVACEGENILASLALPVSGLMSDRPISEVRDAYAKLLAAARELGSPLHDPFMAMSFMALEVIPKLKLTDQGLVDVEAFQKVDLFV